LTLGMTPDEIMLDVFAKADNPNSGGRQMPTHWSQRDLRIVSSSSPVGTQVPLTAGLAWAAKLRGEDSVAVTYMGEGSTSQGDFHEGLNFAAVHHLPLIVVVENNGYAITEVQAKEMVIHDVADRAAAYGIKGLVVDGNDVLLVYRNMHQAVEEVRRGGGPILFEAKTYLTVPHSSDDDDRRYKPRAELEEWLRRDPIDRFRRHLKNDGILTDEHADQLIQEAEDEVRRAEAEAEAAADPDPATLLDHLFGDPS
ncbi:MAG: thiamine pyrophosphate-dependent dehydrogenase E1 component subunit alpha, partial [Dehalococcoidia bacterium]